MNIKCHICQFETEFQFKIYSVFDKKGVAMEGVLEGMTFYYICPKCETNHNIEITFIPKKGFKSMITRRQSDYIG